MDTRSLFSVGLLLVAFSGRTQEEIKQYVQHNTVRIAAIEPDSTDYTDLAAFGDAIGESRVVMLGEQDHGDAATFLVKTRLIKYLHEKKGFNVLAFEGDFYDLNQGWDWARTSTAGIDTLLKYFVPQVWSFCETCQPLLYQYIPAAAQAGTPLMVTGFDCQMRAQNVTRALDSLIKVLQLPIAVSGKYMDEVVPTLQHWVNNFKDSSLNNKYLSYLAEIKQELSAKLPAASFWLQVINSLVAEDEEYTWLGKPGAYYKEFNARDAQMAANLKWLSEVKYAKEKIIVWAHSYHVSKFGGHYPEKFLNEGRPMGTVYTSDDRMLAQTYILGFTSSEGTTGRVYGGVQYKLPKPRTDGFENWIGRDLRFGFIDFRKFNARNPGFSDNFYLAGGTKGNRYHDDVAGPWNRIFDGVFFIRDMYPCQGIK